MFDIENLRKRMNLSIDALVRDFSGLRTGRASADLLNNINVEVYGCKSPINQLGSVSISDTRTLLVQFWDKAALKPAENAIQNANLGVSVQVEGQGIRVIVPELSEERRKELCKVASKYAEQAKVSVRNVRRDGMDDVKKAEKEKELSEDEAKKVSANIQTLTDEAVKKIDNLLIAKEKDILKI